MKTSFGMVVVLLLVGLATGPAAAADAEIDAKKLVGAWEQLATGIVGLTVRYEFTEDNRFKLVVEYNGMRQQEDEGSYKVERDRLTITVKDRSGKEETVTDIIKKLTDDTLILHSVEGERDLEFRKK